MSVSVRLYTFPKRDNSTKLPDSDPVEYTCILKEECGVINPVIVLQNIGNPSPYNYAYIPSFSRYYWIREWRWILGRWEADLYTDVLATFRDYIGNSEQYIVRSSAEYDGKITDSLYPTIAIDSTSEVSLGQPVGGDISNGTYVLGVINDNGGYGAVEYYVLSQSEFALLCDVMFANNPPWYDISAITKTTPADITEVVFPTEVMKSLMNPMQYVVSCMYFTQNIHPVIASRTNLHFGWWNSGIQVGKLGNGGTTQVTGKFALIPHPQAQNRGIYLNLSPYTRLLFNAGPFGFFPLDTTFFADYSSVMQGSYKIGIDCITGEGVLHIHDNLDRTVSVHRAQIGVPIKLAQITRDYLQASANAIQTAADTTSGVIDTIGQAVKGNVLGAIDTGAQATAKVTNGIVSTIKSALPTLTATGSGGSLYELNRTWSITEQHFIVAEDDNANRGRPLAKKRIIKNIPGYIMVEDADVETSGLGEETALIRRYMEGGFFYE